MKPKKLNRRSNIYILVVLIIIFLVVKGFSWLKTGSNFLGKERFRDATQLILTKHVKCRMDCRQITLEEIKEILKSGDINYDKSGTGSEGDSTFALEGYSHENQHIRVVVAPENDGWVVITCIDLGRKWPCNCH